MTQSPRKPSSTGVYHITLRSVNQQIIFEEDDDFHLLLYLMKKRAQDYNVTIYAYCIMSNHIHILLHSEFHALSLFIQTFSSQFAKWYNKKYLRSGHLFQGRFDSFPVESVEYFLKALLYIHENPVIAGMCQYAQEYHWSSCKAYLGAKNPLINVSKTIEFIGSKDQLYHYISHNAVNLDYEDTMEPHIPLHSLSFEENLERLKRISGYSSPAEIQKLNRHERNNLIRHLSRNKFTYKQIARFCGVSVTTVCRIVKNKSHSAR